MKREIGAGERKRDRSGKERENHRREKDNKRYRGWKREAATGKEKERKG